MHQRVSLKSKWSVEQQDRFTISSWYFLIYWQISLRENKWAQFSWSAISVSNIRVEVKSSKWEEQKNEHFEVSFDTLHQVTPLYLSLGEIAFLYFSLWQCRFSVDEVVIFSPPHLSSPQKLCLMRYYLSPCAWNRIIFNQELNSHLKCGHYFHLPSHFITIISEHSVHYKIILKETLFIRIPIDLPWHKHDKKHLKVGCL